MMTIINGGALFQGPLLMCCFMNLNVDIKPFYTDYR